MEPTIYPLTMPRPGEYTRRKEIVLKALVPALPGHIITLKRNQSAFTLARRGSSGWKVEFWLYPVGRAKKVTVPTQLISNVAHGEFVVEILTALGFDAKMHDVGRIRVRPHDRSILFVDI